MTAIAESLFNTASKLFNPKQISHPQRPLNLMNDLTLNNYRNNLHILNLFCFQSCSTWTLNLTSTKNKTNLSSSYFYGTLNQPLNSMVALTQAIPQEIVGYLPIDLCKNQRFVLNPSQAKVNLNIVFDLKGQINNFTNVNSQYNMVLFDINLIGELHGIQLLKDSIDFKVKGYDIQRSIDSVINDKRISHIVSRNLFITTFHAFVFNNIQCSFAIEFCITNYNLAQYYSMLEKMKTDNGKVISICNFGIVINKLKIVYNLPLCVFSHENYKGVIHLNNQLLKLQLNTLNQYPNPNQTTDASKLYSAQCSNFDYTHCSRTIITTKTKPRTNFCNWHSFMTYTTPMIFETEKLLIKNILDAFIKPSLLGIKSIFKTDKNHYTQVNYFPSLSSISIEELKQVMNSHTNSSKNVISSSHIHNQNETSTTDESILTNSNSLNDDFSSPLNKTLFHYERTQEMFNTKTFSEQLKSFFKIYPHCNELTLGDISPHSWFSITWTPTKSFQSKGFYENAEINWNQSSSFKVFYQFRSSSISNSVHFIPVIGILEKNIRGKTVDTSSVQFSNFWFSNFSEDVTNVSQLEQDKIHNNETYFNFLEKGCKLQ